MPSTPRKDKLYKTRYYTKLSREPLLITSVSLIAQLGINKTNINILSVALNEDLRMRRPRAHGSPSN